jgi:DNA repair protein RadC
MYLSRANKVLSVMLISEGGTAGTVADVKKILAPAILQNASAIIISHNHPSGNLNPSDADKDLTAKVKEAAKLIDVTLLDHIIMTDEKYYSFADNFDL